MRHEVISASVARSVPETQATQAALLIEAQQDAEGASDLRSVPTACSWRWDIGLAVRALVLSLLLVVRQVLANCSA
jgi:hypothetical protein